MHQLPKATNKTPTHQRCAQGMVEGLPQVMWFIRWQMRHHRTRGLSVPQFRTLGLLERYPAVGVSAIAEHLGCALPTASRMATGLVAKGLVTRCDCPDDRRQVALDLTPRGREMLLQSRSATVACVAEKISGFSGKQRQTVTEAMSLLRTIFDNPGGVGGCQMTPTGASNHKTPPAAPTRLVSKSAGKSRRRS